MQFSRRASPGNVREHHRKQRRTRQNPSVVPARLDTTHAGTEKAKERHEEDKCGENNEKSVI